MAEEFSPFLIIIPPKYVAALLKLYKKFEDKNIKWIIGGDLGEALGTVKVEPDCIEILTSKEGVQQIRETTGESDTKQIAFNVQQLPRNALVAGKKYPLYIGSYFFEFSVDDIKVEVYGDLQYKINDWDWGDKFECIPNIVNIVGKRIFVVPLSAKCELYQNLGWMDRAERIKKQISKITSTTLRANENRINI